MNYRFQVWGAPGSGKTSFALDGDGTKWYAELDPGSYDRAVMGLPIDEDTITKVEFYAPLTALRSRARLDTSMVGQSGKGAVQFVHKLEGWDEQFWAFTDAFLDALEAGYDRYIVDTSTVLWDLAKNAALERIQNEGKVSVSEARLQRLEYQEPNDLMAQIIGAAKQKKRNLVLIAHSAEIWEGGNPTGKFKADGSKHIPGMVDLSLRFEVKNKKPVAIVQKPGAGGLELEGLEFQSPSFEMVAETLDAAALIRKMGGELPDPLTPENILNSAKVFQAAMI